MGGKEWRVGEKKRLVGWKVEQNSGTWEHLKIKKDRREGG